MKKYIVAIDEISMESEDKVIKYFKEKGFGWWHWIGNFWLLICHDDDAPSTKELYKDVHNLVPESYMLVTEVKVKGWYGFGPTATDKDFFKWLEKHWNLD